jgi:hypothetical protein
MNLAEQQPLLIRLILLRLWCMHQLWRRSQRLKLLRLRHWLREHHGGTVERGSFAAVAQKAAEYNERRAAERQYPENFGELAASAVPAHVEEATAAGPHLRTITLAEAAVVMSLANRAGRHVQHGSFASLCQSAAEKNTRALKRTASEKLDTAEHRCVVVPLSAGGDAAAARTLDFDVVCTALRGTPFDLDTIDIEHLRLLESAAARDHGG